MSPAANPAPKHPLQNEWQLWYWKNVKDKSWEDGLLKVTKFKTVEDFWALYNHIQSASQLIPGSDYCLFKGDIQPKWEDDENRRGGRWLYVLMKSGNQMAKAKHGQLVDDIWLEILLSMIGEGFGEDSEQICGAVFNARPKMDKIALWTADWQNTKAVRSIGALIKERTVPLGYLGQIQYEAHEQTQVKKGSTAKAVMFL